MPPPGPQPIFNADLVTAALQPLNVQMALLLDAVNGLNKAASAAPANINKLGADLSAILGQMRTGVTAAVATAANSLTNLAGQVQAAFGGLVGAFRPDVMARFQIIVNDMTAAVGENLVPVMQAAGRVFRFLADTVASVTPVMLPAVKGILAAAEPIFDSIGQLIRGTINPDMIRAPAGALMALLKALAEPIQLLVAPLVDVMRVFQGIQVAVAGALASLVGALAPAIAAVAGILGILIEVVVTPFRAMLAVLGPLIQLALVPLTMGLRLLAVPFQVLAAVMKPGQALLTAAVGVFEDVMRTVNDLGGVVREVFGELWKAVQDFFAPVTLWVQGIFSDVKTWFNEFLAWIRRQLNDFRGFFGLGPLRSGVDGASSSGKGATPASFTSTEELYKNLVKSTYGAGRSNEDEPQVKSENHLANIWNFINSTLRAAVDEYTAVKGRVESAQNAAGNIGSAVSPAIMLARAAWRMTELKRG